MIHAFALEPQLVARWGRREEFRFVHDKFGLGTPRVMLELPKFSSWKRAVYKAATEHGLAQEDLKRLEELFRLFAEQKCRRGNSVYVGVLAWLENAQREYDRKPFAAILATENPQRHRAVMVEDQLGPTEPRWICSAGATPVRTPAALAATLSAMLINCKALHLVDPHFGPENPRHRKVLEALTGVLATHEVVPDVICVHCAVKSEQSFFEQAAVEMAPRLPHGMLVDLVRWKQRNGGEQLHNRYVLTDLGGVLLGTGLDEGQPGETDDLCLLTRAQYSCRWDQYVVNNGAFERVGAPVSVRGTRRLRPSPRGG